MEILTEEQSAALHRRYNPEGSHLRQTQLELLEMLKELDKICKQHNIRWWLSSGTLLGAARHKGFIPWDDDIDIVLFKRDYKKLSKILSKLDDERFVFQTMRNDVEYINVFGKFRKRNDDVAIVTNPRHRYYKWAGQFIDIFSIEKINHPSTRAAKVIYLNMQHLTEYIGIKWLRRALVRLVELLCLGIIHPILRLVGLINPKGEYHYTLGTGWDKHTFYESDILPLTTIEFEGCEFPAPKNVDNYLSNVYGNWRELPTEEQIKKSLHYVEYIEEFFERQ